MKRRFVILFAILGAGSALAVDHVSNYSSGTLAFGPDGQRVDLDIKFQSAFLTKIRPYLTSPIVNIWMTETGFCEDSEDQCRDTAKRIPHCLLTAQRSGFPDSPLLEPNRDYSPLVNVDYDVSIVSTDGNPRTVGADTHVWKMFDAKSKTTITLDCSPPENHQATEMTKNLFQRIVGDVLSAQYVYGSGLGSPPELVENDEKKIPGKKGH